MRKWLSLKISNMREWIFFKLLKWYCNERLDQWERWEIDTEIYGLVYIDISRKSDGCNYNRIKV